MISEDKRHNATITDKDFENVYAQIEPLAEEKEEIFAKYNTVDRVLSDLGISNAYDMPSFWRNNKKDYKVINTKYHQGYMQALKDVEKEIRKRFGFSEKEYVPMPSPFHTEGESNEKL